MMFFTEDIQPPPVLQDRTIDLGLAPGPSKLADKASARRRVEHKPLP
jgi:hypothetical protein